MITNKTKNKILVDKHINCNTYLQKTMGLMFRKFIGIIFTNKKEMLILLHMLYVFYPIDVILLDSKKRVVELKSNFKPFTFWMPKEKSKYILEIRNNKIKETDTEIGDTVIFSDSTN